MLKKQAALLLITGLVTLSSAPYLLAEKRSPYYATLCRAGSSIKLKGSSGRYTVRIASESNNQNLAIDSTESETDFRLGEVEGDGDSGASLELKNGTITLTLLDRRRSRLLRAEARKNTDGCFKARLSRSPSLTTPACAAAVAPSLPIRKQHINTGSIQAAVEPTYPLYSIPRVYEISIRIDREYAQKVGGSGVSSTLQSARARDTVRSITNNVQGIYLKQLGLQLRIIDLKVDRNRSKDISSTDPFTLLSQFRASTLAGRSPVIAADTSYLFTGKNFSSSILGLAYIGAACPGIDDFNYWFALSRRFNTLLDSVVMAHELGHSLGAQHPEEVLFESPPPSLMTGLVANNRNKFSEFSLGQIAEYIEESGSCLTLSTPRTTLSHSRSKKSITIKNSRADLSTCIITVYGSNSKSALKGNLLQTTEIESYASPPAIISRSTSSFPKTRFLRTSIQCENGSGRSGIIDRQAK